jgi:hypothetical protein
MTNQDKKPDSFAVFALICLLATIIASVVHEIYVYIR